MPRQDNSALIIPDEDPDDLVPALYLLDENHPANDEFMQNLVHMERTLRYMTASMKPAHVEMIKMHGRGISNVEIAETLSYTPTTVSNVLNKPHSKKVKALLAHHKYTLSGPRDAQKLQMLWTIAQENKKTHPNVTIAAIDTLNKMSNALYERKHDNHNNNTNNTINIQINATTMPRTPLDG